MRTKGILGDITAGINSRLSDTSNGQSTPAKPPSPMSRRQPEGSHVLGGLAPFSPVGRTGRTLPSAQSNAKPISPAQAKAGSIGGPLHDTPTARHPAKGKENQPSGYHPAPPRNDGGRSTKKPAHFSGPMVDQRRQTPLTETDVARLGHQVLQSIEGMPRDSRKRENAMRLMEKIVPDLRNMSPAEAFRRINAVKLAIEAPVESLSRQRPASGQVQGRHSDLSWRAGTGLGVRAPLEPHPEAARRTGTIRSAELRSHSGPLFTQRDVALQAHEIMGRLSHLLRGPQSATAKAVMLDVIGRIQGMPVQSAIGRLAELKSLLALPDTKARNRALVDFSETVLKTLPGPGQRKPDVRHEAAQNPSLSTTAPPLSPVRSRTPTYSPAPVTRPSESIPYRSLSEFEEDARSEARYGPTGTQPDYADAKRRFALHNARYEAQFQPVRSPRSDASRPVAANKPLQIKAPHFRPLESFEQDARDEARYGPTGTRPDYAEARRKFDLQNTNYGERPNAARAARPATSSAVSSTKPSEPIPYRSLEDFEQDARDEARNAPTGTQPDYADARQRFDRHNARYEAQFTRNRSM